MSTTAEASKVVMQTKYTIVQFGQLNFRHAPSALNCVSNKFVCITSNPHACTGCIKMSIVFRVKMLPIVHMRCMVALNYNLKYVHVYVCVYIPQEN